LGWSIEAGIIIGFAIGVASTVVLIRVLTDSRKLDSIEGKIAVGWLIVEDILTVAILILLPSVAAFFHNEAFSFSNVMEALSLTFIKLSLLALFMFTLGNKIVSFLLTEIARLRSHELLTISVLSIALLIATGSSYIFGTSLALGAFIAGMVVGQTDVRHQASAQSLPLKDVFAILFFVSVGMLFNPSAISEHLFLFLGLLSIILLVKPIAAIVIVVALHYPLKVAVTIAVALAQIGEFSFILAEEAMRLDLLPGDGYDLLVACAIISISLNPLLFHLLDLFDKKKIGKKVSAFIRANLFKNYPEKISQVFETRVKKPPQVLIIGFGPIGHRVVEILDEMSIRSMIIEQNIDTVHKIKYEDKQIVYGDATSPGILESMLVEKAKLLIITVPDTSVAKSIIQSAREMNPNIQILTRVKYITEIAEFEGMGVECVSSEKEEVRAFTDAVIRLVDVQD
jgi:CPA2 family monovalent cation:H+ antiporter-2